MSNRPSNFQLTYVPIKENTTRVSTIFKHVAYRSLLKSKRYQLLARAFVKSLDT